MARIALLLTTFAALAAWAGAQGTAPSLSAADRAKLFKTNRVLLENLVNHAIDLSDASDPLRRAERCQETALTLANSLERAAADRDPDRVAELANLMGDVVRDGLVPNLDEAKRIYPVGSPEEVNLKRLQVETLKGLDAVGKIIPAGKVSDSTKVKDALSQLAELKGKVAK